MTSTPPHSHTNVSPLSSLENSYHHIPTRMSLNRCAQSDQSGVPLFVEKCIEFIEEYGLATEGLYRISGYKNQVELVINKLSEGKKKDLKSVKISSYNVDPSCDLHSLQVPASAVATALKDMMRKLDEPLLSLEYFDECQNLTSRKARRKSSLQIEHFLVLVDQLREQNFIPLRKAFSRTNELKYRTIKFLFKHLHL